MDSYVKTITLDVNADQNYTIVKAKQGDKINRKIAITLKKDGANFTPTGVSEIWFRVEKPDKNIAIVKSTDSGSPISVSGNVYTVSLSEQCLTASGKAWCDLAFLDSSGNTLSSCAFILNIVPMPNGNTVESTSEWTELQKAIDDAERFADIVAFRTSGNYIQYTVDGTTWVNLTTIGAIGANKTDFIDLGTIDATSREDAIEKAFRSISGSSKPISFKFEWSGQWSGIAYKYSTNTYGTIYATYPVNGASYFGYMVNDVFYVDQVARESEITTLSGSLNTVEGDVADLQDGLTAEQTTRASADTALQNALKTIGGYIVNTGTINSIQLGGYGKQVNATTMMCYFFLPWYTNAQYDVTTSAITLEGVGTLTSGITVGNKYSNMFGINLARNGTAGEFYPTRAIFKINF